MDDRSPDIKGSGTIVYFVLGALVVAVAALAFLALGGQLGGGGQPQTVVVTPPAAPAPPAPPAPVDRDHRDRNDRNDHNDRDRH